MIFCWEIYYPLTISLHELQLSNLYFSALAAPSVFGEYGWEPAFYLGSQSFPHEPIAIHSIYDGLNRHFENSLVWFDMQHLDLRIEEFRSVNTQMPEAQGKIDVIDRRTNNVQNVRRFNDVGD